MLFFLEIVFGFPLLPQNEVTGTAERVHSWYCAKLDQLKINLWQLAPKLDPPMHKLPELNFLG